MKSASSTSISTANEAEGLGFIGTLHLSRVLDGKDPAQIEITKIDNEGSEAPVLEEYSAIANRLSPMVEICVDNPTRGSERVWPHLQKLQAQGFVGYFLEDLSDRGKYTKLERIVLAPSVFCDLISRRRSQYEPDLTA